MDEFDLLVLAIVPLTMSVLSEKEASLILALILSNLIFSVSKLTEIDHVIGVT